MISISIFYHHPIQTLSFFALMMALCSIRVKKTFRIRGSFGIISLASAFVSDLLDPVAFLPLGFFTLLLFGLQSIKLWQNFCRSCFTWLDDSNCAVFENRKSASYSCCCRSLFF